MTALPLADVLPLVYSVIQSPLPTRDCPPYYLPFHEIPESKQLAEVAEFLCAAHVTVESPTFLRIEIYKKLNIETFTTKLVALQKINKDIRFVVKINLYDKAPLPTEQQIKKLLTTKNRYHDNTDVWMTRMYAAGFQRFFSKANWTEQKRLLVQKMLLFLSSAGIQEVFPVEVLKLIFNSLT